MKLLANENFPLRSVLYLRDKGHDVSYVGQEYPGTSDEEILSLTQKQGRTILTFDRDYGELIFKYKRRVRKGVIYLRFDDYEPEEPGQIVDNLLSNKKFHFDYTLTVVDVNGIRQRKY